MYGTEMMNSDNQNWYELRLFGKCPERRAYHSSFTFNKKYDGYLHFIYRMFILGGHDIKEGSTDTLWMLDLSKISTLDQNHHEVADLTTGGLPDDKKVSW